MLGGSSSINGMIYIRGNPLDYDDWCDAYGCTGWGYADLLPYFRRAEDQQHGGSAWHGTGGPLRVEDQRYEHPLSRAWLEAAIAWGLPGNEDFNGPGQDGAGHYQMTQRGGRRWSVADAYLRPAMARPNLTVETGADVSRLLLEGDRATGVRYVKDGAPREATATREVVVACGAVRSPQLLLLSGIGPADDLRAHHLPVVVDAPAVGAGLQDHPMVLTGWRTPGTRSLWEEATPENLERWRRDGSGPMASVGAEAGGFTRSSGDRPAPDLQLGAIPGPPPLPELGPPAQRAVGTLVGAVHVRCRGRVTLASADPGAGPLVDPAYFAVEDDLEVLVAGVRMAREIAAREPLASITDGELTPGAEVDGDDRVRDWIRATSGTMFHPTGTCAMGAGEAVCDPDLRVRGRRGPARGRRLGDAGHAAGQHQRPHHRGGRARRRPHPRRHAPVGPGAGARAGLVRSCAVAQPAVLDRRHAVGGPEGAAEVGGVGQPPAGGDGAHRPRRQRRVQQVVAAPLQPSLPDQAGHAGPLLVEQLVQRAERDMVGPGDGRRREPGVGQPALDEGVDPAAAVPAESCPPAPAPGGRGGRPGPP